MLRQLWNYAWSLRRQFIKYVLVGLASVGLDIGSLVLLKQTLGLQPVTAVIINQPVILLVNFFVNKHWSFRDKALPHWQMARYATLAGANYAFSVGAMYALHDHLGIGYVFSRLSTIAVMVTWNFFAYKYWVYTAPLDTGVGDGVH